MDDMHSAVHVHVGTWYNCATAEEECGGEVFCSRFAYLIKSQLLIRRDRVIACSAVVGVNG